MNSALDSFERALVAASHTLYTKVPADPVAPVVAPPSRPRWRLLMPSVTMVAVVVAAVVVFAVLPGGGEPPLGVGVGQATAREVLARAAQIAATTPASTVPGPSQYLYTKWIVGGTSIATVNGHAFASSYRLTQQDWEAPNGSGRQLVSNGANAFPAPADRSAWQAGGEQGLPVVATSDSSYPAGSYFNNCAEVPPRGPVGLSTDPAALLRQVVTRYESGHYNPANTIETAVCLLMTSAYPPLRAATYRMIERLPGVKLLGSMSDGTGRRGVAVAVPPGPGSAQARTVVILDPVTAAPLEVEAIQTSPAPQASGVTLTSPSGEQQLPNGTVLSSEIPLASGVVNSIETLPGGGSIPYNPPPVVHVSAPPVPANPSRPLIDTLPGLKQELGVLRSPQTAADRLPAWAIGDEQGPASPAACTWCLQITTVLPAETRLLASFAIPASESRGTAVECGPERVYLMLGLGTAPQAKRAAFGGWHQGATAGSGLHLSIGGFGAQCPGPADNQEAQPLDIMQHRAQTAMPQQTLSPDDVMIGAFGTVGVVPDAVRRVRWELITPGQSTLVTVYPKIQDNAAVATPPHPGSYLASAVWYGSDGGVLASVNNLPALLNSDGW